MNSFEQTNQGFQNPSRVSQVFPSQCPTVSSTSAVPGLQLQKEISRINNRMSDKKIHETNDFSSDEVSMSAFATQSNNLKGESINETKREMSELNECNQDLLDEVLPKGKIPQNRLQMRGPSKFGQFGKQAVSCSSDFTKIQNQPQTNVQINQNQNGLMVSENDSQEEIKQKDECQEEGELAFKDHQKTDTIATRPKQKTLVHFGIQSDQINEINYRQANRSSIGGKQSSQIRLSERNSMPVAGISSQQKTKITTAQSPHRSKICSKQMIFSQNSLMRVSPKQQTSFESIPQAATNSTIAECNIYSKNIFQTGYQDKDLLEDGTNSKSKKAQIRTLQRQLLNQKLPRNPNEISLDPQISKPCYTKTRLRKSPASSDVDLSATSDNNCETNKAEESIQKRKISGANQLNRASQLKQRIQGQSLSHNQENFAEIYQESNENLEYQEEEKVHLKFENQSKSSKNERQNSFSQGLNFELEGEYLKGPENLRIAHEFVPKIKQNLQQRKESSLSNNLKQVTNFDSIGVDYKRENIDKSAHQIILQSDASCDLQATQNIFNQILPAASSQSRMTLIEQEKKSKVLRHQRHKQAKSVQNMREFVMKLGDKAKFNELFEEIYRLRKVVSRKDQFINIMKLKIEELQNKVDQQSQENLILKRQISEECDKKNQNQGQLKEENKQNSSNQKDKVQMEVDQNYSVSINGFNEFEIESQKQINPLQNNYPNLTLADFPTRPQPMQQSIVEVDKQNEIHLQSNLPSSNMRSHHYRQLNVNKLQFGMISPEQDNPIDQQQIQIPHLQKSVQTRIFDQNDETQQIKISNPNSLADSQEIQRQEPLNLQVQSDLTQNNLHSLLQKPIADVSNQDSYPIDKHPKKQNQLIQNVLLQNRPCEFFPPPSNIKGDVASYLDTEEYNLQVFEGVGRGLVPQQRIPLPNQLPQQLPRNPSQDSLQIIGDHSQDRGSDQNVVGNLNQQILNQQSSNDQQSLVFELQESTNKARQTQKSALLNNRMDMNHFRPQQVQMAANSSFNVVKQSAINNNNGGRLLMQQQPLRLPSVDDAGMDEFDVAEERVNLFGEQVNPDIMTYEQLLALQERIGFVNKGMSVQEMDKYPQIKRRDVKNFLRKSNKDNLQFVAKDKEKIEQQNTTQQVYNIQEEERKSQMDQESLKDKSCGNDEEEQEEIGIGTQNEAQHQEVKVLANIIQPAFRPSQVSQNGHNQNILFHQSQLVSSTENYQSIQQQQEMVDLQNSNTIRQQSHLISQIPSSNTLIGQNTRQNRQNVPRSIGNRLVRSLVVAENRINFSAETRENLEEAAPEEHHPLEEHLQQIGVSITMPRRQNLMIYSRQQQSHIINPACIAGQQRQQQQSAVSQNQIAALQMVDQSLTESQGDVFDESEDLVGQRMPIYVNLSGENQLKQRNTAINLQQMQEMSVDSGQNNLSSARIEDPISVSHHPFESKSVTSLVETSSQKSHQPNYTSQIRKILSNSKLEKPYQQIKQYVTTEVEQQSTDRQMQQHQGLAKKVNQTTNNSVQNQDHPTTSQQVYNQIMLENQHKSCQSLLSSTGSARSSSAVTNKQNQNANDDSALMSISTTLGQDICIVCQEVYSGEDSIKILVPCNHYFHVNCVNQWLLVEKKCPMCMISLS